MNENWKYMIAPHRGTASISNQPHLMSVSALLFCTNNTVIAIILVVYIAVSVIPPISGDCPNENTISHMANAIVDIVAIIPPKVLQTFIYIKKWQSRWDSNPRTLARLPS